MSTEKFKIHRRGTSLAAKRLSLATAGRISRCAPRNISRREAAISRARSAHISPRSGYLSRTKCAISPKHQSPQCTQAPSCLTSFDILSLRIGHARVLTPHRGVIHSARAASLPIGGRLFVSTASRCLPPRGRWHAERDGRREHVQANSHSHRRALRVIATRQSRYRHRTVCAVATTLSPTPTAKAGRGFHPRSGFHHRR